MPTPKLTKISSRGNSPALRTRQGTSLWMKKLGTCLMNMILLLGLAVVAFRYVLDVDIGFETGGSAETSAAKLTTTTLSKPLLTTKDLSESSTRTINLVHLKVSEGQIEGYVNGAELKYEIYAAADKATNQPISVKLWANLMAQQDSEFAKDITKIIQEAPYPGVYFETAGVTSSNADDRPFQFALVDGETLANFAEAHASSQAFDQQLAACTDDKYTCQFSNLGNDAILVAPKIYDTNKELKVYSHLAAFLRGAPEEQVLYLWQKVASVYDNMLSSNTSMRESNKPVWLSTAGEGVHFLHFRFDDEPKYYKYFAFANEY